MYELPNQNVLVPEALPCLVTEALEEEKMEIIFVTSAYKPAYRFGGTVTSISAVAEGLARRGHHITVLTTNCNADEDLDVPLNEPVQVDGVTVWYFKRYEPIKKYFWWSRYLSQTSGYMVTPDMIPVLKSLLPTCDVVHTQMPCTYMTRAAFLLARQARKPLFYSQRGMFHPDQLKYRRFKKMAYINLEKSVSCGCGGSRSAYGT